MNLKFEQIVFPTIILMIFLLKLLTLIKVLKNADDKIYVCKILKTVSNKLYYIENPKTRNTGFSEYIICL